MDIQIWKIVSDVLLVVSLIYLSYKIAKGTTAPLEKRALGLEANLRMLLDEAEQSSKHLNEKLLKRQSELQKSLFEIKSHEERLETTTTKSESIELRLKEQLRQAEIQKSELESQKNKIDFLINKIEEHRYDLRRGERYEERYTDKKIKKTDNTNQVLEVNFETASEIKSTLDDIEKENIKIPNEPIKDNTIEVRNPDIAEDERLDHAPRVKKQKLAKTENQINDGIQEIYDAAENLLRAGKDVNSVATETTLSLEEVSMLSQMVNRESELDEFKSDDLTGVSTKDARLGVLGQMSRKEVLL